MRIKVGQHWQPALVDNGKVEEIQLLCRIDTLDEVEYYRHGGILQYVLRNMMKAAS